ncbi:MAG: hypothetical protein Fur0018_25340 [Anaerolineales bacterium]
MNKKQPKSQSLATSLWENSEAAKTLKVLQNNPRVRAITIVVPANACPACQQLAGTYAKAEVPPLPLDLCSHPLGCRATYQPMMEDIYP